MKKQKSPKGATASDTAQNAITDPRFTSFTTDPRFRLPSKKRTRTKIDKRFSRMLKDDDFANTAKVDRYGRKLSNVGKKKALRRLYQPEEDEEEDDSGADEEADIEVEDDKIIAKELKKADTNYDPARGGGFSSSEEDEEDGEDREIEVEEAEFPDLQNEQAGVPMGEVSSRIAVVNLDWDNIRAVDLMAVFSSFVGPGGRIKKMSVYKSEFGKERMEREELEGPPKEIFARKPQREEEELEVDSEDESEDESEAEDEDEDEVDEKIKKDLLREDDGQEFDSTALRQYQLERLRYYYAVMVCSDKETANCIYTATDGTEYLSSANFFDLRFIPNDVEFDEKPRDECISVPDGYRPTEFVTDALQHSKVKLTWDAEDTERKDMIKRAFSGSRAQISENDLRAYLGSDNSSSSASPEPQGSSDSPKPSKKELARQKMRVALGLPDEPTPSLKVDKPGPVGDMEITFNAGLSAKAKSSSVFANAPIIEESTAEAYIRKERERKARRREKARARREGHDLANSETDEAAPEAEAETKLEKEDLGFNDPFFTSDVAAKEKASKAVRKEAWRAKCAVKEAEAVTQASERAALELLMDENINKPGNIAADGAANRVEHFDIQEIARAEKLARKKRGKSKNKDIKGANTGDGHGGDGADTATALESKRGTLQTSFKMDVSDPRFSAVFEKHEFAIDPSNPKFRPTEGMRKLLEEGRRKRARGGDGDDEEGAAVGSQGSEGEKKRRKENGGIGSDVDLRGLVKSVKKKAKK